jgi:flagellar biosynthesis protein FlhB
MSDRTEAPTGQRINKAREEGQIARSVELNTAAIMLVGILLLQGPGKSLVDSFKSLLIQSIHTAPNVELNEAWISKASFDYLSLIAPTLLIILAVLLITGAAITLVQTKFLWASKKIGFDLNRINPLNNLKRIFSPQGWIELLRSLLKLGVVGWAAYGYLQENLNPLMQLGLMDLGSGLGKWTELAFGLAMRIATAYLVLAIADYLYQRWNYLRGLKMTKEEIKEEYKQQEGDPYIKSRIRAQMRKLARMRMMSNVPKANVVITNPTHLAVAIQYDHASMTAPKVVAKGAHLVAFRIVDIAKEHGIPVIQNIPLARAIYRTVEIDQEIPPELYAAMAEILVYVYRLKGKQPVFAN